MQAWAPRQQLESAVDDTTKMTLSHDLWEGNNNNNNSHEREGISPFSLPSPRSPVQDIRYRPYFLALLILKRGKVSSRLQ